MSTATKTKKSEATTEETPKHSENMVMARTISLRVDLPPKLSQEQAEDVKANIIDFFSVKSIDSRNWQVTPSELRFDSVYRDGDEWVGEDMICMGVHLAILDYMQKHSA